MIAFLHSLREHGRPCSYGLFFKGTYHCKVKSILSLQNVPCPIVRNVRTDIWNVTPVKADTGRNRPINVKVSPQNVKISPLNVKVRPLNIKVNSLNVKVSPLNVKVNSLNVKVSPLHYRKMSQKCFPISKFQFTSKSNDIDIHKLIYQKYLTVWITSYITDKVELLCFPDLCICIATRLSNGLITIGSVG